MGDVDCLITRTDNGDIKGILERFVIALEKKGFLKERLGDFRYSKGGSEGYMGVCQVDKNHPFRRIDIKAYPRN